MLFGELLTAQLFATNILIDNHKSLEVELARFFPDEIVLPSIKEAQSFSSFFKKQGYFVTLENFDSNDLEVKKDFEKWISGQFTKNVTQQIFENEQMRNALSLFYLYMRKTQESSLGLFKQIHFYDPEDFLIVDNSTQKNLELIKNNYDGGRKNSLLSIVDNAITPMGSRTIKKWILRPLVVQDQIEQRLDVVQAFVSDISLSQKIENTLRKVGDFERVVGRIALNRAHFNDYVALINSLESLPDLYDTLVGKSGVELLKIIVAKLGGFNSLYKLLFAAINDDFAKDRLIKNGFDKKLDDLRELSENAHGKILELEKKEKSKTSIASLKIRYNQVQGYYIEVTKPNVHLVPEEYSRHQTLVGKERFTTQELKALQSDILQAKHDVESVEKEVFERIKNETYSYLSQLRALSQALSHLDGLIGLAKTSYENNYVRPSFNDGRDIIITDGRHSIVEKNLQESFITNSSNLTDQESLWIITGPNMGGKSTYLRQVALICLMAQCGVFVPAKNANVPLLDRIFTRIGASDLLAEGKSTFLVEMEEAATICLQATQKSLVILDEVGRGTSTFDGLAIAQAVVEYIYTNIGARCLFATHYHELTHLQDLFSGISSYYTSSKQAEQGIVFLHKIVKGVADGSFGIEVAKLAHLPEPLIERAYDVLEQLRQGHNYPHSQSAGFAQQTFLIPSETQNSSMVVENRKMRQMIGDIKDKLKEKNKIFDKLSAIDFDNLSPRQAFDILWKIKE